MESAKTGRPSLYRPEYCERVIELGAQGYSKAQIAFELGKHSTETLDDWGKANSEFSEALARARAASLAFWELKALKGLENRDFNSNLYRVAMQGRFSAEYRDAPKAEITVTSGPIDTATLSIEERAALRALLAKASAKPATIPHESPIASPVATPKATEAKPLTH